MNELMKLDPFSWEQPKSTELSGQVTLSKCKYTQWCSLCIGCILGFISWSSLFSGLSVRSERMSDKYVVSPFLPHEVVAIRTVAWARLSCILMSVCPQDPCVLPSLLHSASQDFSGVLSPEWCHLIPSCLTPACTLSSASCGLTCYFGVNDLSAHSVFLSVQCCLSSCLPGVFICDPTDPPLLAAELTNSSPEPGLPGSLCFYYFC